MKEINKRILLVDDEPNILIALEFLLHQEGYIVQKAFNGLEAMDKLHSFNPGLVVLDVMMPGIDGFEVAKRIRNSPGFDKLHIVFLTAKGASHDKIKGYENGAEVYITKPFDNDDLVRVVNETIHFG